MPDERCSEHVAVGVDGSLSSRAAVRWALEHAHHGDLVELIHAWQPSASLLDTDRTEVFDQRPAKALLERELARTRLQGHDRSIVVRGTVLRGRPEDCLRAVPASVIVVGTGDRGGLSRRLLGSVSAHLARHCAVPLVIVPHPGKPPKVDTARELE